MSGLPEGWTEARLGDICSKPQYGYTTRASHHGKIKFVRTTDITKGLSWSSVPFCEEDPADPEKYQLYAGDIIISRAGSVGFSALIETVNGPSVFASYLIRFRAVEEVDRKYLKRFLESPVYWSQITEQAAGNAVQNVNAQKLAELKIIVPPRAEQTRIAAKLEELLAQVDTLKARIDGIPALLKRFRQSVLAAAVSGRLTEEWRAMHKVEVGQEGLAAEFSEEFAWSIVRLGEVAQGFSYGSSAKSKPEGDIPVLRMGNIQGGRLDWEDLVFSSDHEEIKKYSLQPGDVLFNRTNSPELVGKTAIYKGEQPAIYAGYLIRVRCAERIVPDFLNYCLNSPQGRDYCWQVKTDGVSQSNINAKKLADFRLGLPSIEEQTEIVRRVGQLFAFADQLEARVITAQSRIDRLTQSILAKAFRGEMVPQDPNDEPASVLLERIKAQRAAAPKAKRGRKASA